MRLNNRHFLKAAHFQQDREFMCTPSFSNILRFGVKGVVMAINELTAIKVIPKALNMATGHGMAIT